MKTVSIVIGLYNSEKTIEDVLREIQEVFEREKHHYQYEVVLVNDGSPDNVLSVVRAIAMQDSHITVIDLAKNVGQTNAVIEGYKFAKGDYIVEMDDDFQMPAEGIIKMLNKLEAGNYDVVFAKYLEQKESSFRLIGSKVNNLMTQYMLDKPKNVRVNSFFVMRRFVKDEIIKYSNKYPYIYGIIFAITKNVANEDIVHRPRTNGKSNYSFKSLFGLWLNGFLNYSVQPLRIATHLGVAITSISFVIAVILIIQRIIGPTQSIGWTSLIVTIIFFAGVQLVSTGLLGEYIGRLFLSSSGLPRATVREVIRKAEKKDDNCITEENYQHTI